MKNLILCTLLMAFGSFASALSLDCSPNKRSSSKDSEVADGGFEKFWDGTCKNNHTGENFFLKVEGKGLNIHASIIQGFILQCPRIQNPVGTFYGYDFQVTAIGPGLGIGYFENEEGFMCAAVGAQFIGLGLQMNKTTLTITKTK